MIEEINNIEENIDVNDKNDKNNADCFVSIEILYNKIFDEIN